MGSYFNGNIFRNYTRKVVLPLIYETQPGKYDKIILNTLLR